MEQVISQAKIQTAKEIKQQAKDKKVKKNIFIYVIVILILLVLAYFVFTFIQNNKYGFVDKESGITFRSGDFYLADAMESLSKDQNIYLVLNVLPEDMNNLSQITQQLTYLLTVLSYKNKNVTIIVNVMDEKRGTISCQSNLGNYYENKELTKEECSALLNSGITEIIIDFPKENLKESTVIVNANIGQRYIYIQTKTKDELQRAVTLTTGLLFKDIAAIEDSINNFKINMNSDINSIDANTQVDANAPVDANIPIDANIPQDTNIPIDTNIDQNI
ncbi:MAG: hypothetical protein WCF78_01935 [archaeon]